MQIFVKTLTGKTITLKEKLNSAIRMKIYQIILKLLSKAPPYIKSSLKDPDMFKWI